MGLNLVSNVQPSKNDASPASSHRGHFVQNLEMVRAIVFPGKPLFSSLKPVGTFKRTASFVPYKTGLTTSKESLILGLLLI